MYKAHTESKLNKQNGVKLLMFWLVKVRFIQQKGGQYKINLNINLRSNLILVGNFIKRNFEIISGTELRLSVKFS